MVAIPRTPTMQAGERWRKGLEGLTPRNLIQYFDFHNRTEGQSPKTLRWNNQGLGLLERFLARSEMSMLIKDSGEPDVRAFIAHLQN